MSIKAPSTDTQTVMSVTSPGMSVDGVIVDAAYIIAGFALLMGGGEGLVQGAIRISERLSIPPLLVGFTVVAVGTSLPELAVALEAVLSDSPEIAVGGVLGSNVANVMLVLGTAAVLGACSEPDQGIKRDSIAVIVATLILTTFVLGGEVPPIGGVAMILCLLGYYVFAYMSATKTGEEFEIADSWLSSRMAVAIPACIIGGMMIWFGAKLLVSGATGIAGRFGVSEAVIGLTVIALGTSLPELAVTLVAGLRGQGGVAIGNVLGSNVMNILGIIGLASIIGGGIEIASEFAERDIWVVIATSGLIAGMLLLDKEISKGAGSVMIAFYLTYMGYLATLGVL